MTINEFVQELRRRLKAERDALWRKYKNNRGNAIWAEDQSVGVGTALEILDDLAEGEPYWREREEVSGDEDDD